MTEYEYIPLWSDEESEQWMGITAQAEQNPAEQKLEEHLDEGSEENAVLICPHCKSHAKKGNRTRVNNMGHFAAICQHYGLDVRYPVSCKVLMLKRSR